MLFIFMLSLVPKVSVKVDSFTMKPTATLIYSLAGFARLWEYSTVIVQILLFCSCS